MRVLILDSSYTAVGVASWMRALTLVVAGKAEIMEESEHIIRTVSKEYKIPLVIRRLHGRTKKHKQIVLNRNNVFFRDDFTCTYCLNEFPSKMLTLDHVIPKSRGGKNTWENLVTSCHSCNAKKANKTPKEAGMALHREPFKPVWSVENDLKLSKSEIDVFGKWFSKG